MVMGQIYHGAAEITPFNSLFSYIQENIRFTRFSSKKDMVSFFLTLYLTAPLILCSGCQLTNIFDVLAGC